MSENFADTLTDAERRSRVLLVQPKDSGPPVRWPTRSMDELRESAAGLGEACLPLLERIEECLEVMPDLGGRAGYEKAKALRLLRECRQSLLQGSGLSYITDSTGFRRA